MSAKTLDLPILYEDNHVIVVEKRPGMLSQGDLTGDLDVLTVVKQFIKKRDEKPGNVYLGLVHRLDRPVGGVMVLAKTSKAASRLSRQFRERSTKKIYRAVVSNWQLSDHGKLEHFLLKDRSVRKTSVVDENAQGAKKAQLHYRVLAREENRVLIEIELITGLPHQIRVQLAASGAPIVGDKKYGSTIANPSGNIALFAASISFEHPVTKQTIRVKADSSIQLDWNDI